MDIPLGSFDFGRNDDSPPTSHYSQFSLKLFRAKHKNECTIHGHGKQAANRALLSLVLLSLLLIVWHVWAFGPSNPAAGSSATGKPFPMQLGHEVWDLLVNPDGIIPEMWMVLPYFIVGILIAGFIRTYKLAMKMQRSLARFGFLSIFLASLIGVLSPLCACGILTTAISLLFAGLPMPPIMALLVSSPLMSPTTYLVSLSDLGPEWTVIRTVAAFLMGLFAGLLTHLLQNRGFRTSELFIEGVIPRGDFHDEEYPREDLRCSCKQRLGNRVAVRTGNKFLILLAKSAEMLWPIGKYVLIGITLGTIIEWYVPSKILYSLFGKDDPLNVVWITLGTIPIFLHQISASGVLYHIRSGINGTLYGAAALAFLIGGPVTAVPTMTMLWAIFRKRLFFLYLFICVVGTITLAYSFQYFVFVPHVDTGNPLLEGVEALSAGSASVIVKTNRHVRVVMNPHGKNLMATYLNYLAGKGPAVFDAGGQRFLQKSFLRFDNARYLRNIAEWLEENGTFPQRKKILIYDLSTGAGPDRQDLNGRSLDLLRQETGFQITRTDRAKTPQVTDRLLDAYSQIWILAGEASHDAKFSEPELQAIKKYSDEGGGLLIAAGPRQGRATAVTAANQVSAPFGVAFKGETTLNTKLQVSTSTYLIGRAAEALGKYYRLVI